MRALLILAALLPLVARAAVLEGTSGKPLLTTTGHPTVTGAAGSSGSLGSSGLTSLALVDFQGNTGTSGSGPVVVVQRTPGTTQRNAMPVAVSFTGTAPTSLRAQVVSAAGGAVVLPWAALSGLSCSGTLCTGSLAAVPQGGPYLLQVQDGVTQPTSGALFSAGTHRWGVGVVIRVEGQSNMQQTMETGYQSYQVPGTTQTEDAVYASGAYLGAVYDNAGWHAPSNGAGCAADNLTGCYWGPQGVDPTSNDTFWATMRLIAGGLKTKYGYQVPVALVPYYIYGQPIANWLPGGSYATAFDASSGSALVPNGGTFGLASSAFPGGFEGENWYQGEADAGDTITQRRADLASLVTARLAEVSAYGGTGANFFFANALLGPTSQAGAGSFSNMRTASLLFEGDAAASGWSRTRVGWMTTDLAVNTTDNLHLTSASAITSNHRMVQTDLYWLGAATFSGRGPQITGPGTRSGGVVTVPVTVESGTALKGATGNTALTGFTANTASDFSGTAMTISAAIVGGQLQLTVPSGAYWRYLDGNAPVNTNLVYDSASYPTGATGTDLEAMGLPLLPTAGSMVAP